MSDEELIDAALDDRLDDAQRERFARWLAGDRERLRAYLRAAACEQDLVDAARGRAERHAHGVHSGPVEPVRRAPRRRASRAIRWGSALAAALVVAWLARLAWPHAPRWRVTAVTGEAGAVVVAAGSRSGPAAPGGVIRDGDRIEVADGAGVELRATDTTVAALGGGTRVACADGGHAWRLDHGDIALDVTPQPSDRPLVIATADARAVVEGTRLRVASDGRATLLEVRSGAVAFARPGRDDAVSVGAGEYAMSDGDAPLRALALPTPPPGLVFDFDRLAPIDCPTGRIVPGPPRPGGRRCLAGEPLARYPGWRFGVFYAFCDGHFRVAADAVFSFSYYLEPDADAGALTLYLYSREQDADYRTEWPKPVQGRWARASVRLTDLAPAGAHGALSHPAVGDVVTSFNLAARTTHGFYLADIAVSPRGDVQ